MNTIRAWFRSNDGKMRGAHQIHINDDGKPLCRCRTRVGVNRSVDDKWVIDWSEPTCPVCIRMEKRRSTCV